MNAGNYRLRAGRTPHKGFMLCHVAVGVTCRMALSYVQNPLDSRHEQLGKPIYAHALSGLPNSILIALTIKFVPGRHDALVTADAKPATYGITWGRRLSSVTKLRMTAWQLLLHNSLMTLGDTALGCRSTILRYEGCRQAELHVVTRRLANLLRRLFPTARSWGVSGSRRTFWRQIHL
jgi:hypothetical protein